MLLEGGREGGKWCLQSQSEMWRRAQRDRYRCPQCSPLLSVSCRSLQPMYRVAVLSCPVSLLTLLFEPRRRPKGKSLSPRPFCQQRQGLNIVDNITSIHFAFGGLLFFVAAVSAGLCGGFCGSCEKEMESRFANKPTGFIYYTSCIFRLQIIKPDLIKYKSFYDL